jgi:hypothetical protein
MGTTISKPSDVLDRASEIRQPSNLKLAFRKLDSISNLQCDLLVPKSLPLVQVGERGSVLAYAEFTEQERGTTCHVM